VMPPSSSATGQRSRTKQARTDRRPRQASPSDHGQARMALVKRLRHRRQCRCRAGSGERRPGSSGVEPAEPADGPKGSSTGLRRERRGCYVSLRCRR
jgi:hypothetical protein